MGPTNEENLFSFLPQLTLHYVRSIQDCKEKEQRLLESNGAQGDPCTLRPYEMRRLQSDPVCG